MKTYRMKANRPLREISKQTAQYLYQDEHMETDRFMTPDGEYIVQGRVRYGEIKQWFGLDKRIRILWKQEGDDCVFSVDSPVMMDKILVAGASLLGLWPLLFAALYGLWDQLMLLRRIRKMIVMLAA